MANFKELKKQEVKEEEKEILEYWKKINILDECMEERKNNKNGAAAKGEPLPVK